ncbi:MAG TPA: hypothetical protein VK742_09105 [Candidatus Sulfotelmatobacter sp.]|jgi:hypothetical protein|nr:hypothetical protein [Candidatus Sulfotelmatobacter sp.]
MKSSDAAETGATANLAVFLKVLAAEGKAAVSATPLPPDAGEATLVLHQIDEHSRDALALDMPPFSAAAALWAAQLFYQLCRFTVCRDIGEEEIKAVCGISCPEPRGPAVDWSADLTLRHLPKLFQLARHLSHVDPLVGQMKRIATEWPLSSVGIPGLENVHPATFVAHPGLRRLYADRIFATGDASRLGDLHIDSQLRSDLGEHRDLASGIAAKLLETT